MPNSIHQERLAVITGAGRGIGRAYASRLAADGARVVLADLEDPVEAAGAITDEGGNATAIPCDVSDPADVEALASAVAEMGGADILVHNAGIYPMQGIDDITYEDWKRVFSVNLDSLFLLSKAFLPHMREQGWGRIVAIGTGMFHEGAPGALHYVASKGGVIGFVRSLSTEVGGDGITVNAISPGLIRSEGTSTGKHDALFELVLGHQSVKRNGLPEDLVGAMSFLVSDDAGWMTGQTMLIDGGGGRI